MPYVERIYEGKPTGGRYYTPESARKHLQREKKAADSICPLLQKIYEGKVTVKIIQ